MVEIIECPQHHPLRISKAHMLKKTPNSIVKIQIAGADTFFLYMIV